ncbi:hypothetical protein ACFQPG_00470 [Sphingomonas sp. GCM10030256]|uniref:hypothetical protein n=1 Tax=Sphingomonas sp. GCM10030256 TaxID=3273427 RepID=UPI0036083E68
MEKIAVGILVVIVLVVIDGGISQLPWPVLLVGSALIAWLFYKKDMEAYDRHRENALRREEQERLDRELD